MTQTTARRWVSVSLGVLVAATSCKNKGTEEAAPPPSATASVTPSAAPGPPPVPASAVPASRIARQKWPVPTGPVLAILEGAGVGPIRIGATVATIERHMQAPCEVKTKEVCRYIGRAVEFLLDDAGITREVRVHRGDRPSSPAPRTFGVFNGRFPGGAAFGMYPDSVIELLRKPDRVETRADAGANATEQIHHYPGMRLEYDRLPNGNVVLGGVVIFKPQAG